MLDNSYPKIFPKFYFIKYFDVFTFAPYLFVDNIGLTDIPCSV